MKLIAVFTTVATREDALRIASALVERKLAACAQICEIDSFYAWKGAMQHEPEFRILLKTTDAQYGAVEAAILELHRYELPAIHAVAVDHAYEPYAAWVIDGSSAGA